MIRTLLAALTLLSVTACSSSAFEIDEKLWLRIDCAACNVQGAESTEGHAVVRYAGEADAAHRARVEVEYVDVPPGNTLELAQRLEAGQTATVRRDLLQEYEAGRAEAQRRADLRARLYELFRLQGPDGPAQMAERAPAIIRGLEDVDAPVDAARARGVSSQMRAVADDCLRVGPEKWLTCMDQPNAWDGVVADVEAVAGAEAIRAAYRERVDLAAGQWQAPRDALSPRHIPMLVPIQQTCSRHPRVLANMGLQRERVRAARGRCIEWITEGGDQLPDGYPTLESLIDRSTVNVIRSVS